LLLCCGGRDTLIDTVDFAGVPAMAIGPEVHAWETLKADAIP
jgi:hypothetical protein